MPGDQRDVRQLPHACGQFGSCCSHTGQTGSWGCAAESLLFQELQHPHLLHVPWVHLMVPELWKSCWELSSLKKLAELLGAEFFHKNTAQGVGLNLLFLFMSSLSK